MKKLSLFLLLFSFSSYADQAIPICPLLYTKALKQKIEPLKVNDKVKHCSASCLLTLRCGPIDSYSMGLLKEIFDLMGMGNPEIEDIKANMSGIYMAVTKRAVNDQECMDQCTETYKNYGQTDCGF